MTHELSYIWEKQDRAEFQVVKSKRMWSRDEGNWIIFLETPQFLPLVPSQLVLGSSILMFADDSVIDSLWVSHSDAARPSWEKLPELFLTSIECRSVEIAQQHKFRGLVTNNRLTFWTWGGCSIHNEHTSGFTVYAGFIRTVFLWKCSISGPRKGP